MPVNFKPIPVDVVGSSTFGLYPKISLSKTYNMFISDGWVVNYAGYKRLTSAIDGNEGRAAFYSVRGDFLISVIDDKVYKVTKVLGTTQVGTLNTRFGEVFIDENLSSQICIVDGNDGWIFNYDDNTFTEQTLTVGAFDVNPGYVTYHNSFFLIAPSVNDPNNTNNWYAFQRSTDSTISHVSGSTFPLQTKPDVCLAVKRLPGKSNHVLVIGSSVCEVFTNVGGEENYRRNSSFNIDSGTVSRSTIAANENFLCFLAQNENNAPTILVTDGSSTDRISTDGIDGFLQNLTNPSKSTAFFYRQDGHLFYQISFLDPNDNVTLIYDFMSKKFFHVTDDQMNAHPARQVAYFGDRTIFVGFNRGSIYELSTEIDGAFEETNSDDGKTIPRIRVTSTIRLPNSTPFYCNNFQFWMEQGVNDFPLLFEDNEQCSEEMITEAFGEQMLTESGEIMITEEGVCADNLDRPRVDMAFSKIGNVAFSNFVGKDLNAQGKYRNRIQWHRLGFANEVTFQLRFYGLNRFIANNGTLEIGQ